MGACQLLAVLLIVGLSCAEALICNYCVPRKLGGTCTEKDETCERGNDVCASVTISFPKFSYFKRCMKKSDAKLLETDENFEVYACSTDRCN